MRFKRSFLSAFRVMNFIIAERAWRTLAAEADFRVEKELPKKDILIIAPHPDDEIFGCAGALASVGREQRVQVAYIFSGDKQSVSKLANDREEESKEAMRLLTNPEQIFFRQPDNSVVTKQTITGLASVTEELTGGIIFLPSFSDPNIDHRESVGATVEAVKIAQIKNINLKNISIWLYEIWSPLPYFNRLLEFDWKEKKKAMEKFTSQKKERNYLKAIKSLNEYRGEIYGLKNPAEAFFAIPADLLVKLYTEK